MNTEETFLKELIARQTESLNIEFKRWITPSSPEGIAKIVKACIAMKNNNGGYLFIGFDEETRQPDFSNLPTDDIRKVFSIDDMQTIISKYSYPQFEIDVHFIENNGREYPCICIDEGVRTPTATKSELRDPMDNNKILIKQNIVYVRTLRANGTPSTSEATYQDWDTLMQICFDNREADIGRFIRRHLANINQTQLEHIQNLLASTLQPQLQKKSDEEHGIELLDKGKLRFEAIVAEKRPDMLPEHGSWEVICNINSNNLQFSTNEIFLNLLSASNPNHTGWPIWLDSRQFADPSSRPYVYHGAWEALIVKLRGEWSDHIDFWRLDPCGIFYLYRALEDDVNPKVKPMELLDYGLPIWRVGEAIAVGISFAKAMGHDTTAEISFSFRWSRLKNRLLSSWTNPIRIIHERRTLQDEVVSHINVPLSAPMSTLYQYVDKATKPLYQIFEGFEVSSSTIEELTLNMLGKRR